MRQARGKEARRLAGEALAASTAIKHKVYADQGREPLGTVGVV